VQRLSARCVTLLAKRDAPGTAGGIGSPLAERLANRESDATRVAASYCLGDVVTEARRELTVHATRCVPPLLPPAMRTLADQVEEVSGQRGIRIVM
jgi:hypothetical protein